MSELAVEVVGLQKSYGNIQAVRGIDLRVTRGEIFALIGPNGAGKTTTVEILEGFRKPDGGNVRVLGQDATRNERSLKERVGIVLQDTSVERYLTVEEVIELFCGYYARPKPVDEIIRVVGLADRRSSLVRRLSGGQQRRLDVGIGLAGDPELVFLDEPTTGFDPAARRAAWEMIRGLKSLGKTVFLTTHNMDEAEALADRVAIIAEGRIVAEGTPDALMEGASVTRITLRSPDRDLPDPLQAATVNGRLVLETTDPTRTLHQLTEWALERNVSLEGLTVATTTLEDVYLSLVSRTPEERS